MNSHYAVSNARQSVKKLIKMEIRMTNLIVMTAINYNVILFFFSFFVFSSIFIYFIVYFSIFHLDLALSPFSTRRCTVAVAAMSETDKNWNISAFYDYPLVMERRMSEWMKKRIEIVHNLIQLIIVMSFISVHQNHWLAPLMTKFENMILECSDSS